MSNIAQIAEEIAMIGPRIGRKILMDIFQIVDISHSQLFVIIMLSHNGPSRVSDISKELQVAAPTATGIVGRLEKAGYVTRGADKDDRRAVMVELTAEGQKLSKRLREVVVKHWTEILGKISRADGVKYLEILKKINEAI